LTLYNDSRYTPFVIKSFRDADTELFFETGRSRRMPANLRTVAARKLFILDSAVRLEVLQVPPGNRLEALHGDREGQHSIRINDQYRICFAWGGADAYDVEIVDYR
jgi:proteic killer suppression protein